MPSRNMLATIVGLLLLMLSVAIRLRAQCSFGGYENYGNLAQRYCQIDYSVCGGDYCESDYCLDPQCGGGSGWITYCTSMCGAYPGCFTCARPQ